MADRPPRHKGARRIERDPAGLTRPVRAAVDTKGTYPTALAAWRSAHRLAIASAFGLYGLAFSACTDHQKTELWEVVPQEACRILPCPAPPVVGGAVAPPAPTLLPAPGEPRIDDEPKGLELPPRMP